MHNSQPIFSRPVKWTLGVLSWVAFGAAALLAWKSMGGSAIAGCIIGSNNGCDVVQSSSWSKWLGIPVAMLGLACYASLATLSGLLWVRSSASRWIETAFLLMSTVAAGASAWFVALQVFVIGEICVDCLITDQFGIVIGAIAAWAALRGWTRSPRWSSAAPASATIASLRSAIPSTARLAPVATRATPTAGAPAAGAPVATSTVPRPPASTGARTVPLVGSVATPSRMVASPPSLPIAFGGALALLLLLVGGQLVFPAKTFDVQKVALKDSVDLSAQTGDTTETEITDSAAAHVANRLPADGEAVPDNQNPESISASPGNGELAAGDTASPAGEPPASETAPQPTNERKIELLGGKLMLNVADEPIIGSVKAPHVVVEMISYDCPHCRKTNRFVKRALARYGDQVAVVVLILPMEGKCNKLIVDPAASHAGACTTARTAVALAKLRPSAFSRFHEFLMSGDEKKPPSLPSTLSKVFTMADRDELLAIRDSPAVEKKIASYVDLYALLHEQNSKKKDFGLPIQILGDHVMSGGVEKAEDLFKAWEEHLGVKPR